MLSLNDTADVVGQNLGQNLVLHGRVGFAPDRISKLRFDHREGTFDVGSEVVSLKKHLSMVVETIEQLRPQPALGVSGVALEGDQGSGPYIGNRLQVLLRRVSQVSRHLTDSKVVGCVIEKGRKHGAIVGIWPLDFHGCNNVGVNSNHDVSFDPSTFDLLASVLMVMTLPPKTSPV